MIRAATAQDFPAIRELLARSKLPVDGVDAKTVRASVWTQKDRIAGVVALEPHGEHVLLRSLVVDPSLRGKGVGKQLLSFAIGEATSSGFREAYGLTETIAKWLPRMGFEEVPRTAIPTELHKSKELTGACPDTAVAFRRVLAAPVASKPAPSNRAGRV